MARKKAVPKEDTSVVEPTPAIAADTAPAPVDDLDDILGEITGTETPAPTPAPVDDLDDILGEITGTEAPAPTPAPVDDLNDILGEITGTEAPAPTPAPVDDLNDILGEITGTEAPAPTPAPVDDLNDILGEITGTETPAPTPAPVDDLDDILGEFSPAEAPVTAPNAEAPEPPASEPPPQPAPASAAPASAAPAPPPADELPKPARPIGAHRGKAIIVGLVGFTLFAACNGLSFYLGTRFAAPAAHGEATHGEHQAEHHAEAPPPPEGLERYVGQAWDGKVDNAAIFQNPDVVSAINALAGGQALMRDIENSAARWHSPAPISRRGERIFVHACNPQDCERDAIVLQIQPASKDVLACLVQPENNGGKLAFAYSTSDFHEVAGCGA